MKFSHQATVGLVLLCGALGAWASTPVVQMGSRQAPVATPQSEAKRIDASEMASTPLHRIESLPPASAWEGLQAKATGERIQEAVSFGREPFRFGIDGRITVAGGIRAILVDTGSRGALRLRTAWRFDDGAEYDVALVDSGSNSVTLANRTGVGLGNDAHIVWSAVSEGDSQRVLIRRLTPTHENWTVTLERVAHFDRPLGAIEKALTVKSLGDSAYCQKDIACIFGLVGTTFDDAAIIASRSVAFMLQTDATGNSFTCTGTLLNSANYPAPLFLTANHCVAGAVALDTFWFYSRTNCGFGSVSPAIQITGGATRLWTSAALDSALLLLYELPPAPASYSGWNSTALTGDTLMLAIHHPRGDVKKASLGNVVGINSSPLPFSSIGTFPAGTFYVVDWQVGIVEPGSSGSAFFTERQSNYALQVRGTLTGGNTTCSGIASRTYYSRFDKIYPNISGPLSVPAAPSNPVVVEYFHSAFGHYFVTAIADEITKLDNGTFVGWTRTGQSFKVYPLGSTGTSNVCRFFTVAFAPKSSHFYTPSSSECATVKNNPNWKYEALVFAFGAPTATGSCGSGTQPLYRLYNNGKSGAPNHRYTISSSIRSAMIGQGWVPEGNGALGVIGCVPV